MAEMDIFAAMGISGFGKASKKRELDPARFDKNKRSSGTEVCFTPNISNKISDHGVQPSDARSNALADTKPALNDADHAGPSSVLKPVGRPPLVPAETERGEGEEPEFDPSDGDDDDVDQPQFPITHEIVLKDHTKVVSALTLDPSGARILSGSHDYDCKLWDFGGMDMRCKPFLSWEPAGTYHVRVSQSLRGIV
jgi:WD40 repeat protein